MAYDEDLAEAMRELLGGEPDVAERRMFGGVAFSAGGNLAICASSRGGLLVRVDPEESEALVALPGVERMGMNGREMAGWVRVDRDAVEDEGELGAWVGRGLDFARSLPPK